MAATIEFLANSQSIGEVLLNDTAAKSNNLPGVYLDVFFVDAEDKGLPAETPYDPATQSQCVAIDNSLFTNADFEAMARGVSNHLKMGETVELVFKSDGKEIKRRHVKRTNYWFFVDGGLFSEKLRLIISEPIL